MAHDKIIIQGLRQNNLKNVSLDLHNEDIDNVKTEYEEKFSGLGYKINYLEALKEKE